MAEKTGKLGLVVLLTAFVFAGCSTAPVTRSVSEAGPAAPTARAPGSAIGIEDSEGPGVTTPARPRNPAVVSLEADARRRHEEGDLEHAVAALERALRIDPVDAELWLMLAEVRLDLGRPEQAASLARKAESLADPGSETAARARALVARAAGR